MRNLIDIVESFAKEVPCPPAPQVVNGRLELKPEHIAYMEWVRHDVRVSEGLPGQCGWVCEVLQNEWGWDRAWGTYTDPNGDPVIDHCWNFIEPSGIIVDPTADQIGEGHSIAVIHPGDPDYQRYRLEWGEDYNPDHADYDKAWPFGSQTHDGLSKWDGEKDWEKSARLRKERGPRWWLKDKDQSHWKRYADYSKEHLGYDFDTEDALGDDNQENFK